MYLELYLQDTSEDVSKEEREYSEEFMSEVSAFEATLRERFYRGAFSYKASSSTREKAIQHVLKEWKKKGKDIKGYTERPWGPGRRLGDASGTSSRYRCPMSRPRPRSWTLQGCPEVHKNTWLASGKMHNASFRAPRSLVQPERLHSWQALLLAARTDAEKVPFSQGVQLRAASRSLKVPAGQSSQLCEAEAWKVPAGHCRVLTFAGDSIQPLVPSPSPWPLHRVRTRNS